MNTHFYIATAILIVSIFTFFFVVIKPHQDAKNKEKQTRQFARQLDRLLTK